MSNLSWKGKTAFAMALSLYGYITFCLFWPYNPMTIHSIKIVNSGNVVYAGDNLIYEISYTKAKEYQVLLLSRQLIDGYVVTLAPVMGTSLPIGSHKKRIVVDIPKSSATGTYYMHLATTYRINPLRTITVSADSDRFSIQRRDKGQSIYCP